MPCGAGREGHESGGRNARQPGMAGSTDGAGAQGVVVARIVGGIYHARLQHGRGSPFGSQQRLSVFCCAGLRGCLHYQAERHFVVGVGGVDAGYHDHAPDPHVLQSPKS